MVGLVDVADRHGREPALVADLVGERGLEHAAVDRLAIGPGLAGRDVDQVGAGLGEGAADLDRLVGRDAGSPIQSLAEMRTDIGLSAGQAARIAAEHLEREAQPVLEAAAIFVGRACWSAG